MSNEIELLEVDDLVDLLVPTEYGNVVIAAQVIYKIDYNRYLMAAQDRIFVMSGIIDDYDWMISKPIDLLSITLETKINNA